MEQEPILLCPKLAAQSHIQPVSTEACQDSYHARGYDKRDTQYLPDFNFVLHIFTLICRQIVLCSWGFQCMELIKNQEISRIYPQYIEQAEIKLCYHRVTGLAADKEN
jgi:hypothetical protein